LITGDQTLPGWTELRQEESTDDKENNANDGKLAAPVRNR
jgi:hypothetical protein